MENWDIAFRKLASHEVGEFIRLIKLFELVFEREDFTMPDQDHLQRLLAKESFGVFVAEQEGTIIGGLTTYVLEQYYSEKPLAYIYDLAVAVDFQRKGVGKGLIAQVLQHYQVRGFEEIFVQAENEDTHALDFYRRTDPAAEDQATLFSYLLNK